LALQVCFRAQSQSSYDQLKTAFDCKDWRPPATCADLLAKICSLFWLPTSRRQVAWLMAKHSADHLFVIGDWSCQVANFLPTNGWPSYDAHPSLLVVWHCGSVLVSVNEVKLHWTRLVLGWVTISRFSSRCQKFILVCNH